MSKNGLQQTPFKIVPMAEKDLPEVMCIEKTSFPVPWTEQGFRNELVKPFSYLYVARAKNIRPSFVLGYVCFWIVIDELHLLNLAVRPDHRREGIGLALLSFAMRMGKKGGAQFAILEVRPSNAAAIRLYQKAGFALVGKRPGYYSETKEDALVMECDLVR